MRLKRKPLTSDEYEIRTDSPRGGKPSKTRLVLLQLFHAGPRMGLEVLLV